MGEQTGISWCDHTFNLVWGCVQISPACANCYAKALAERMGFDVWGKDKPRRILSDSYWREPLKWNRMAELSGRRKRVFCSSMADVMEDHPTVESQRQRLWPLIEKTPWLDWLLLTKRPENCTRLFPESWEVLPRNIWLMTTIESPEYLWRADEITSVNADIRGLSIEPLVADLPTLGEHLDGIDWVILGGESGPKRRPLNIDHARNVRDQCKVHGVAFHFKQIGGRFPTSNGCLLDGIEYKEFPKAA